jgi:hypothetical protein
VRYRDEGPEVKRAVLLVVGVTGLGACRLIAGIHDVEATDASSDVAHPPGDAGACQCSGCTTLAKNLNAPASLVLVDANLYVLCSGTDKDEGSLVRVPTTGGSVETLEPNLTWPISIATDDTNLYWLAQNDANKGIVAKRPVAGGSVVTLASGQGTPGGASYSSVPTNTLIALTKTDVYFVDWDDCLGLDSPDAVNRVPIDGGPVEVFLSDIPLGLGADASTCLGGLWPIAIQTDGKSLFVMNTTGTCFDVIFEVPLSGGSASLIADELTTPTNFALAGSDVVYLDQDTVQIIPQSGGAPKQLTNQLPGPWTVLTDDTYAYCLSNDLALGPGSIVKVKLSGGATTTLATSAVPQAFVTDSENIYWVDSKCGTVMSAPK